MKRKYIVTVKHEVYDMVVIEASNKEEIKEYINDNSWRDRDIDGQVTTEYGKQLSYTIKLAKEQRQ